jgi:DNA polymerase epsilon subunit 2
VSRKRVQRAFQMNGLTLRVDACDGVLNVLKREDHPVEALQDLIENIKAHMSQHHNTSATSNTSAGIVTQELLQVVVSELSHDAQDIMSESIQLLNALETPRLNYDAMRKEFTLLKDNEEKRSLFGQAEDKPSMFIQRLALVQQRLLKQDLFRPKLVSTSGSNIDAEASVTVTLTPVESLLGKIGIRTLLGMLTQVCVHYV